MSKKKITVAVNNKLNNSSYINFLLKNYDVTVIPSDKVKETETIDLVLFIGGEDVYPGYYNQGVGSKTKYNDERDSYERRYLFDRFPNTPKLGICRGSQFLTVLNGGQLIQHVEGHANGQTHAIQLDLPYDNGIYNITSTHHQMMYPFNLSEKQYQIVGYSKYFLSDKYLNGKDQNIELPLNFVEPEIVYYPETKSLCIQGHPEMNDCPEKTKQLVFNLMNYFLKL